MGKDKKQGRSGDDVSGRSINKTFTNVRAHSSHHDNDEYTDQILADKVSVQTSMG